MYKYLKIPPTLQGNKIYVGISMSEGKDQEKTKETETHLLKHSAIPLKH